MTKFSPENRQKRKPGKNEFTKMPTYYIPIDAEFNADLCGLYGRKEMDARYQLMRSLLSSKSSSKFTKNIGKVKDVVLSNLVTRKKRPTIHLVNHQGEVSGYWIKVRKIPLLKFFLPHPSWIFRAQINNNLMKLSRIRETILEACPST